MERSAMAWSVVEGEDARTVPQQICTVGSSDAVGSAASFSAVARPEGCERVCCASAQRDCEAGSGFEERAERTVVESPVAIRARCWRESAVGRLVALRLLMS